MGGIARVKAGCVGVHKRVASDQSDQYRRGCAGATRSAGNDWWKFSRWVRAERDRLGSVSLRCVSEPAKPRWRAPWTVVFGRLRYQVLGGWVAKGRSMRARRVDAVFGSRDRDLRGASFELDLGYADKESLSQRVEEISRETLADETGGHGGLTGFSLRQTGAHVSGWRSDIVVWISVTL
jgi:hypothetical protein